MSLRQTRSSNRQPTPHATLLERHFQQLHGGTIVNFTIRTLRSRYILTRQVNSVSYAETVPRSHQIFNSDGKESDSSSVSSQDSDYDSEYGECTNCDAIGPLGQYCGESSCKDSGNIYGTRLRKLRPARQTTFDQEHYERTGKFRTS